MDTVRFTDTDGTVVEASLIGRKGAWLTIDHDGGQRKLRNSNEVEILTPEDMEFEAEHGDKTEFEFSDLAAPDVEEEEEEEEEDEGPLPAGMSNQLAKYRSNYVSHSKRDGTTASGRAVVDNADTVSDELRGLWLPELYARVAQILCQEEGCDAADVEIQLRAKYSHLNNGQQSMNLRNRVRGMYKRLAKQE
jgi:hypothetical protein